MTVVSSSMTADVLTSLGGVQGAETPTGGPIYLDRQAGVIMFLHCTLNSSKAGVGILPGELRRRILFSCL